MVQTVITDEWVGSTSGKIRVDFSAGEDAGPLVFKDAINMLEADWLALTGPQQTALMETRYTNWVASVAASSSYVRTDADWRQEMDYQEAARKEAWDAREAAKAELIALTPLTKQEWLDEEALQEQIRLDALSAKSAATTEAGKL